MNKTAFLTGSAGFLGRHLVERLLAEDWCIHTLVRGPVPSWLLHPAISVTRGSLEIRQDVARAMPNAVDAVFHLAGNTSSWNGAQTDLIKDNVLATNTLLDVSHKQRARRIVMTSTLGLFSNATILRHESMPLISVDDNNPYLRTKRMADELLNEAGQRGMSVVSLHPGHILGKYDRSGWVTLFTEAKAGKLDMAPPGSASFCAASEVALAHVRAATLANPSRRYVLGGADTSYRTLFSAVAQRVGAKDVTRVAPAFALQVAAQIAQLKSRITRTAPTITPGLAAILIQDMLADSALAQRELHYANPPLATMLDDSHAWWLTSSGN